MVSIKRAVTSVTSSVFEKQKFQIIRLTQKSLKFSKKRHNLIPLFKVLLMSIGSVLNSKI
jgi:hypothetical protein